EPDDKGRGRGRGRVTWGGKEGEGGKTAEGMGGGMANLEVETRRRVGEPEVLYGSVTTSDIAEALAAKGFEVDRRKIQLKEPLKKLGEVDVSVRLQRDVTAAVKVRGLPEGEREKSQKT